MAFQDDASITMARTAEGVGERSRQPKRVGVGSREKQLELEYHGYGDGGKTGRRTTICTWPFPYIGRVGVGSNPSSSVW